MQLTITLSDDEARGLAVLVDSIGIDEREHAYAYWLTQQETLVWPEDHSGNVARVDSRVRVRTPIINKELALATMESALDKLREALPAAPVAD